MDCVYRRRCTASLTTCFPKIVSDKRSPTEPANSHQSEVLHREILDCSIIAILPIGTQSEHLILASLLRFRTNRNNSEPS